MVGLRIKCISSFETFYDTHINIEDIFDVVDKVRSGAGNSSGSIYDRYVLYNPRTNRFVSITYGELEKHFKKVES